MLPKPPENPQLTVEAAIAQLKIDGNFVSCKNLLDSRFSEITYDSRKVTANSAFFCLPGEKTDGNQFIGQAYASGAPVIFSERAPALSLESGGFVQVKDARRALASVSAHLYRYPSNRIRLIGITGTNGKTTTTHLVEHILGKSYKVGLVGTLGARTNVSQARNYLDLKHTTPQASDLQKLLFEMEQSGVTHVAMEVSSHALALKRVAGCDFSSIALTNLTQDHLDFHKTMEGYFASKGQLFLQLNDSCQTKKTAVVNRDDPWSDRFISLLKPPVKLLTYGFTSEADLFVAGADFNFSGTELLLDGIFGKLEIQLKINGKFNVYNVMAAILLCTSEGVSISNCIQSLKDFNGVSGRFEKINSTSSLIAQPLCLVDYAHTPDGLENVLKSARDLLPPGGKVIAVFGCGGDRDASKRPQMGAIAEALADISIVTSDNPRSEEPEKIIADIIGGIKNVEKMTIETDRHKAINLAISLANPIDIVVVAGKGHETYQILKDKTIDFDDRLVVKEALNNRLSR